MKMKTTTSVQVCLLMVTLMVGYSFGRPPFDNCPSSWESFRSSCYGFVSEKMSWFDANANCLSFGGHLVEIESLEENEFIKRFVLRKGQQIWIGLNDLVQENNFVLPSRSTLAEFTYWSRGEPNNHMAGEHCVEMFTAPLTGQWNDKKCSEATSSVCEIQEM